MKHFCFPYTVQEREITHMCVCVCSLLCQTERQRSPRQLHGPHFTLLSTELFNNSNLLLWVSMKDSLVSWSKSWLFHSHQKVGHWEFRRPEWREAPNTNLLKSTSCLSRSNGCRLEIVYQENWNVQNKDHIWRIAQNKCIWILKMVWMSLHEIRKHHLPSANR